MTSSGPISNFEEIETIRQDIDKLTALDKLLKCSICYEYFETCVSTSCSHNFCSLCIRQYIQYKTECPVCFTELYDSDLRTNRIVDRIVETFPALRERVIRHLRTLKTLKPNCVYVTPEEALPEASPKKPTTPSKVDLKKLDEDNEVDNQTDKPSPCASPNVSSKILIPKIFQSPGHSTKPQPNQAFVQCPVCTVNVPEKNVNLHLDKCLERDAKAHDDKRPPQPAQTKRQPLPKLVYAIMSIHNLKAKLKEYGLSCQGEFETLKARLQRYTVLYNAECDKECPKPVPEIIRQLEKEEQLLSATKCNKSIFFSVAPTCNKMKSIMKAQEKRNKQYLEKNKDSFQKLIKTIKEKRSVNPPTSATSVNFDPSQPSTSKKAIEEYDSLLYYPSDHEDRSQEEDMLYNRMDSNNINQPKFFHSHVRSDEDDSDKNDANSDDDCVLQMLRAGQKRNKSDSEFGANKSTLEDDRSANVTTLDKFLRTDYLDESDNLKSADLDVKDVELLAVKIEPDNVCSLLTDENNVMESISPSNVGIGEKSDGSVDEIPCSPVAQRRSKKRKPIENLSNPIPARNLRRKCESITK